ncbi:MAG: signal peptide peptidase SppA [Prevotellaceae bacterium]|jgi:protease-4|nr:signal peptide peptidase SppA [Prevotellaceae bacterium]
MKNFFQMLLASVLGGIIIVIVCFFLFVGFINALVSFQPNPVEVKPNSILKISLNKNIVDKSSNDPFEGFDLFSLSIQTSIGLNDILKSIDRAKHDSYIKGIYLDLNDVMAQPATAEEIRRAIASFRESGKFVISYADYYSQLGYYLATAADKIYLNPFGDFGLYGMRSEIMFYKNLLEKLGIDMQILRHGKFKSAVEPFMLDKMSPENREQIMAFMGSIWDHILQTISLARGISIDELNRIADKLELSTADNAKAKGFVDDLMYKDEIIAELCKYTEKKSEKDLNIIGISEYKRAPDKMAKYSKNKIAVIYAEGEITQGEGSSGIKSDETSRAIRTARNDSSVKAIVFRVNSPGGDALASEVIARELELAKQSKPVVVSMGNLAASGGYWISTPGDIIFANHTTITGSIGVFGQVPNIQKGLKEIVGITIDVAKTNAHADMMTIYRPLEPVEKEHILRTIENIYDKFISKVSGFRGIPKDSVDNIGQGRVWSGDNASALGLVDRFGGLNDAISHAVMLSGVSEYKIMELPQTKSTFDQLMDIMSTKIKGQFNKGEIERTFERYNYILKVLERPCIQARLPYDVILY